MNDRHYIVMPVSGWQSSRMLDFNEGRPLRDIAHRARLDAVAVTASSGARMGPANVDAVAAIADAPYTVVASTSDDGPKLVAMSPEVARRLRIAMPSALVEPNQRVVAAVRAAARIRRHTAWSTGTATRRLTVRVLDAEGREVVGARVLAYADSRRDVGGLGRTGKRGTASFRIPETVDRLPRLWIESPPGFHGAAITNARIAENGTVEVTLRPVDPSAQTDALRRWSAQLDKAAGKGVRVAVIDSGVNTAHPDLTHVRATVLKGLDGPGDPVLPLHPHATHVAGIIGARGAAFRGLAGEADIVSLRVTKTGEKECGSYHLGGGITQAASEEDVHLINVSMTADRPSGYLSAAAAAAFRNGAVCIAAAGNDGRDSVSVPAASKRFLAVTAYADRSVLAADAIELRDVGDVLSETDATLSRAGFSNWGSEVDFIAPGVGIISCHADKGYAADSGTSFAAPAITGLAAAVLSRHHPDLLTMPKGPRRAAAITQALLSRGRDLGFAFETQGTGIIDV